MANDLFDFDLGDAGLGKLDEMESFYKRNAEAETKAAKAKGGVGTNKLDESAREFSQKRIGVRNEIDDRLFGIHQERSMLAQETDEMRKAPVADSPQQWADNPDQYDWPGIDLPRR